MSLRKTTLLSSLLIATVGLSGCSTIGNLLGSDDSYRNQQALMVADLEVPPNLFNPAKANNRSTIALLEAEKAAIAKKQSSQTGDIPTFAADGVNIQSNLSERWLELRGQDSQTVWGQLQRFFNSQGFRIDEARKDIGIMKTTFLAREEIVPTDDQGPLTKLLNSWRDQLAKGVYDKFVARVESQGDAVKIYFSHHMMYSGEANQFTGTNDSWSLKPSNPVMEAEALYQAMVFFGSTAELAAQQLAATQKSMEIFEGEEFAGLKVQAGFEETWNYMQTAVYRAGWDLGRSIQSKGIVEVKVPATARNEQTLLGSLAFWKERDKTEIPETILIVVQASDEEAQTLLTAKSPEGELTLNSQQKQYIFESLGLLNK